MSADMNHKLTDAGWSAMEKLLNEHMPVKKRRRPVMWLWVAIGLGILAIVGSYFYTRLANQTDIPTVSQESVESSNDNDSPLAQIAKGQNASAISSKTAANANQTIEGKNPSRHSSSTARMTDQSEASYPTDNETTQTSTQSSLKKEKHNDRRDISEVPSAGTDLSPNRINTDASNTPSTAVFTKKEINKENTESSAAIEPQDISVAQTTQTTDDRRLQSGIDPLSMLVISAFPLEGLRLNIVNSTDLSVVQKKPSSRWALYGASSMDADRFGVDIGIGRFHQLGNRLELFTGVSYEHLVWNKYDGARKATTEDFASSLAYTQYLADEQIKASSFIRNTGRINIPLRLQYNINRFALQAGLTPGVQIYQTLHYAPLAKADAGIERNPSVGSDLSANDFFNQKSIGTISSTFGAGYRISDHISIFLTYEMMHSDIGHSVNYAGPRQLERLEAGEIARPYYALRNDDIRPKSLELNLFYRF